MGPKGCGFKSCCPDHHRDGASPSGKATDFDSVIRTFESCRANVSPWDSLTGRTAASEPVNLGSKPSPKAIYDPMADRLGDGLQPRPGRLNSGSGLQIAPVAQWSRAPVFYTGSSRVQFLPGAPSSVSPCASADVPLRRVAQSQIGLVAQGMSHRVLSGGYACSNHAEVAKLERRS